MRITKYYCDICGKETKTPTDVRISATDDIRTYSAQYIEMCDECLKEFKEKYRLTGWTFDTDFDESEIEL